MVLQSDTIYERPGGLTFLDRRSQVSPPGCLPTSMYLLYADESGTTHNADQQYFVLAGFSAFERQGYWIANKFDDIAAQFNPSDPMSIELHGNPMLAGRGFWRGVPRVDREQAIEAVLQVFMESHQGNHLISNRLFASVIRKAAVSPANPVTIAFEQLAVRFDKYLMRLHLAGNTQRGLIIFDKSTFETTIQGLAVDFRTIGHTLGILRNFAEVPLFMDSKSSRLIQLADIIAYAIFRHFEKGDSRFYTLIRSAFDSEGGLVHGLHEIHG